MQFSKNKTMAILIALILVSSTAISIIAFPTAEAHTPVWSIQTTAYISAEPNPVGVGQNVEIVMLLNWVFPGALIQNNIRPHGFQLTVTKPDGTASVTTYDPYDPGSSRFILYAPDQVGNYTLKFVYPGEVYHFPGYNSTTASTAYLNDAYENDTFLGSSATTTFTVQANPIAAYQGAPVPSSYWTRPIFDENIAWDAISSNWLGGAATSAVWQKDGTGPMSAHIMWTKPARFGGLVGAGNTDPAATFYDGFAYEIAFNNPLIVSGMLFYQNPLGHAGTGGTYQALDLRTGQTLWTNPAFNGITATVPSKAQMIDFQSGDQHGTTGAILWQVIGATWVGYDAFSGQWICNLTNVPSGTEAYTPTGDILRYVFNYNATKGSGWLALWNDTHAMTDAPASAAAYGVDQEIRINGQVIDASISTGSQNCYSWNVTIPTLPTGSVAPNIVGIIPGDIILGTSSSIALASLPRLPADNPWIMWALNLNANKGTVGQLLWTKSYAAPPNNITIMLAWQPIDPVTREWSMTYADTGERLAYSLSDGSLLWGPVGIPDNAANGKAFQYYSSREGLPINGNLYVSGYGGQMIAYSMLTGKVLWTFNADNSGTETPWGMYPIHMGAYANGVVYAFNGEHSPNTPFYKGYKVYAINATDGTKLWSLVDWSASGIGTSLANLALADGNMVFLNGYDQQVYCLGQGPSATTVSVQNNIAPQGTPVIIQGTVMDVSAGTKQNEQAADFPNGVPVASEASMSDWMSYVYEQQPMPTTFTGVPVTIDVLDSNGNYRNIGTATTTASGTYSLLWTPDISGSYQVIATFHGSNGYYGSFSRTSFDVMAAHPTAAPTATPAQSVADMYFVPAIAGLFVLIIIVAIVLAMLMLRKRP